jgi:hypothetical protein
MMSPFSRAGCPRLYAAARVAGCKSNISERLLIRNE